MQRFLSPRTCFAPMVLMLASLLLATAGYADPARAPDSSAQGVFGESSTGKAESVSKTGKMIYSYAFDLPSARGSIGPRLGLSYSSSERDREAGYGWSLNLPVIERRPLSGNPCSTPDGAPIACGESRLAAPGRLLSEERYTYNGQPIVFICQLPGGQGVNDPGCEAAPQPNWADIPNLTGWRYFRLQVEGQFARLYLSPDRRWWRVQLKGGDIQEFGEPPDHHSPGIEHPQDNQRAVLRWRLVRQSDGRHQAGGVTVNFVDYRWKLLGQRGLLYLTDIFDTLPRIGPRTDARFAHHTQLTWEPPGFPQTFYADPYRATPDLRLSRVAVSSMSWNADAPREVLRTYILKYAPAQGTGSTVPLDRVFQLWHQSFLEEIRMEGRCGQFEDDRGDIPINRECPGVAQQQPVTFEYSDGYPVFGVASISKFRDAPPNALEENRVLPFLSSVGVVDFNRDGLPDIVQGWDPQLSCGSTTTPNSDPDVLECQNARPMAAYLNEVIAGIDFQLAHQCFDAGRSDDTTGLSHYGLGAPNGFFSTAGGATLVGTWGEGVLAWSNASYSPYIARPLVPEYQLTVMSAGALAGLPTSGKGMVIVAKIGTNFHVRIFDKLGGRVFDGGEDKISENEVLLQQLESALIGPIGPPQSIQDLIHQLTVTLGYALPFEAGTGCDDGPFNKADFHPGWKWEKGQGNVDWAKSAVTDFDGPNSPPGGHGPFGNPSRWFTDIDGDGLTDRLADTGVRASDFNVASVEFTRRYAQNEPLPGGGEGPAQIPFVTTGGPETSLAPSNEGRPDTKYFYADINGDGLVDLVTQNPADGGGVPKVRPGDGHGHFYCVASQQPWPCQEFPTEQSASYEIVASGSRFPWPWTSDTFFQDVTADGLADIVQYDMPSGEVRVWINQDGHTFACVTATCVAGIVLNANTERLGLGRPAAFDIGEHRVTFADMNANGVADIVILAKQGVYVGRFMEKYVPLAGFERGAAPGPGLLIRIHNGLGATTDVRYRTLQSIDQEAKDTSSAWQYHAPVADTVVIQVITQDDYHAGGDLNAKPVPGPFQFKRKVQYFYQDPAYDRWSRSLAGFRRVVTREGDEVAETATSSWFGPCQNNNLVARLESATDIPLCPEGSDNDPYQSMTGQVVRIDRGHLGLFPKGAEWGRRDPRGPSGHLWTKIFTYAGKGELISRDDRRVTFSYPATAETFLYDDALPLEAGGISEPMAGGDPLIGAPHQNGIRRHLVQRAEYDSRGTLKRLTNEGSVKDEDSPPSIAADAVTVTLFSPHNPLDPDGPSGPDDTPATLPCNANWQCLPEFVTLWTPQQGAGWQLLKKTRYTYDPLGDPATIEGWLDNSAMLLNRHPGADGAAAPVPEGQAGDRGWHLLAALSHDIWGNLTRFEGGHKAGGSPAPCTDFTYDKQYQQLPFLVQRYTEGCAGPSLDQQTEYDRGFGQAVRTTAANGSMGELRLDPFGRPASIFAPNPDAPSGTVLAASVTYGDLNPISYVDVRRVVGSGATVRSVVLQNGLGEPAVAFDQGDHNDWNVHDWTETNTAGQVVDIRRPWAIVGDPVAIAANVTGVSSPGGNSDFNIRYDDFGRPISANETGSGMSQDLWAKRYFPLAVETRDAAQLTVGGPHSKAFQRAEFDGRGHQVKRLQHVTTPVTGDLVTTADYTPLGQPEKISRTQGGSSYTRTLVYNTLGQLMLNREPNTGNDWRYAWDDAGRLVGTSDARGCGVNFYYDGLGRILGEDYWPCLASQPPYTSPNLATSEGLETLYHYDSYEPGQISPDPTFSDRASLARGHLVSVRDRGSATRFSYDARGRVRRVARALARPEMELGAIEYTQHWFTSRLDYDLGDRLARRTTGADTAELLVAGASEERYSYTTRGALSGIDTSYGKLINNMDYDPDGALARIVYGDARGTTARYIYDERRRLSIYQLIAPAKGATPPIGYFDNRYSAYDEVGNPLTIEDFRIAWTPLPAEAAPVEKRTFKYDDLYRLTQVDNSYKTRDGMAPWLSPFAPETAAGDRGPVPLRQTPTRIAQQTFSYDGLGNLSGSDDDLSAWYDRSLGTNLAFGTAQLGPNQLRSGNGVQLKYDDSGDVTQIRIDREGSCLSGQSGRCAQLFAYDWDEVGQLARARRWDFEAGHLPPQASPDVLPATSPTWDLSYAYSLGARVRKSVTDDALASRHTLEIFDTLRAERVSFDPAGKSYRVDRDSVQVYPGGLGHAFWDGSGLLPHQTAGSQIVMHLVVSDHLGSSSVVINHATSELVERTTYQPYGAIESDHRPSRWNAFREPYKFTGKEEDIEVGATYFGARYYQPYLGRFLSPDPLTVHGLGSDLNPYAYVGGRVFTQVDHVGLCGGGYAIASGTVTYEYDCGGQSTDDRAAHAEAMASQAEARRTPLRQQPEVKPAVPDWTTQTEWRYSEPDPRLIQPVTNVDTGNRTVNFALNKVLLPWRNALSFYTNIPFAIVIGVDEELSHSAIQVEYRNAAAILPMAPAMGIAVEVGPALGAISGRLGSLVSAIVAENRVARAETNLWEFVNTKNPADIDYMLKIIEDLAKTPQGRQDLMDVLTTIPAQAQNPQELVFFYNVRAAIQHSLKPYP
ncbi:RHS repeat-associated core domain-containing protein [Mesorhizobium sp. M1272]|uniref:RHS repeat-associated core domain-containing protein n=1 Tax=Mesorhizobium sp. M1272 TaxID=2957074 RepID=UPI00333C046C